MWFLTSGDLDLWPFELKIGSLLTAKRLCRFDFCVFFCCFRVTSHVRQTADGRTDWRTSKTR